MKIWSVLGALFLALSVATGGMMTSTRSATAQSAPIDPATWMVGEWTGTSQAGVAFTFTIDAKGTVNYVFGGRTLPTGPAEKAGDSVKFFFTSAPGHYIQLTPTGANSGNWLYVGGNNMSRSTITRKR